MMKLKPVFKIHSTGRFVYVWVSDPITGVKVGKVYGMGNMFNIYLDFTQQLKRTKMGVLYLK